MNEVLSTIIGFICIAMFIHAVYTSSRRLASLGYATLAFVLVIALGMVSTFFLVPSPAPIAETSAGTDAALNSLSHSRAIIASVAETNKVINMIALATTIGVFVAVIWAAYIPPRRTKA